MEDYHVLNRINTPEDLKKLTIDELLILAKELRNFVINIVSKNGGHLGASLGVVELTIAIHYVFDVPNDSLVWDVGHQAYIHKILTGRKDIFHTNRKYKGISGFPKISESEYDSFGVGHSSTSISSTLGIATADRLLGNNNKHIAVIGDGALTGGIAFEGLNHAGSLNTNMLVILNDNCMSIDPNVGALKEYLIDLTISKNYNRTKDEIWKALGKLSNLGNAARKIAKTISDSLKGNIFDQSNFFESLKFRYFGPIDGHDLPHLIKILNEIKSQKLPILLHCHTMKGKGYKPAEDGDSTKWHAPGLFDKETGEIIKNNNSETKLLKYQDIFGYTLLDLAKKNNKIVGVTPAMPSGCSMNIMMKEMPNRAFDVGIAEQHAVTFSAGMATKGLVPFCNIYSSFMQRAYDQLIHDVALQKLKIIFCLDRGGLVGEDGPTHHGVFDLAYLQCIPDVVIGAPMNEIDMRNMMYTAQLDDFDKSIFIRYPRGNGVIEDWNKEYEKIEIGKAVKLSDGKDIAVLTLGKPGNFVQEIQQQLLDNNINISHYDFRFLKPIDKESLDNVFTNFDEVITIEDGTINGGFGTMVSDYLSYTNNNCKIHKLGVPDKFIEHGTLEELYQECGFDSQSIFNKITSLVKIRKTNEVS